MLRLHRAIKQLGVVSVEDARSEPRSGYTFATRALLLRNHLLLGNQSSVHIMCDPNFVNNIRESSQPMILKSNGGSPPINEVANFEGFKMETGFLRNKMTNILSFSLFKSEYNITYDGDAFIIHWAAKGYSDMVFKPHKSGLHVYDPDNPRGLASHCFMEIVESNMLLFTKRQIQGANLARNLQAGLAFPSNADMKWAIQSNLIKDCLVTVKDMGMVIKVWGPSIAMLKGKTVMTTPPVVRQDVIEIPKEIRELHKDVTLTIDIFFVNKIPFFTTYYLIICFLLVTHLSNRKALTIFNALKSMCGYYLQQGFQVVFIKGDGEFAPLEAWMAMVYGAPKLNLASANKHIPEIERKIWVIKEWVRAVIYSIQFNSLPAWMLVRAVLFVTKQLNLFPVKGRLSLKLSSKQIISGEVVQ